MGGLPSYPRKTGGLTLMPHLDYVPTMFKFLNYKIKLIFIIVFPLVFSGCSFDEKIVKECGQEHPNSLWGQILCQNNKRKEASELIEKIRLDQKKEARVQCLRIFTSTDFPAKAEQIFNIVKNDFDKDIKFISTKLTQEVGLIVGKEYVGNNHGDRKWKSLDFVYQSKCDVKHIRGITTITYDESGALMSMGNHSEWINSDKKKVKNELDEFSHPKFGNPNLNKKLLGSNFYLISELEKRLGSYDRSEGCFYFLSSDKVKRKEQIQIPKGWTESEIWPKGGKYCLVVDKIMVRKNVNDEEVNIILTGKGQDGVGRQYPGIVSVHSILIQANKTEERYHSLHPVGRYQNAPTNWEPVMFSNAGPTGWIIKEKECAQGCWDTVTFLVPFNGKYWETYFNASSQAGYSDAEKTNFKLKYEIIDAGKDDKFFALNLEVNGMNDGLSYKRNAVVNFDLKRKVYAIPKNFIPPL